MGMFGLLSSSEIDQWWGKFCEVGKKDLGCISRLTKPQHRLLLLVELQRTEPTLVTALQAWMRPCFGSGGHTAAVSPPLLGWLCAHFPHESLAGESGSSRELPFSEMLSANLRAAETGPLQSLSYLWSQIKTCGALGVSWPSCGQDGEDFTSPVTGCRPVLGLSLGGPSL